MATLNFYCYVQGVINEQNVEFGSLRTPTVLTIGSNIRVINELSIAASSNSKIFDVDDDLSDFDLLWVASDRDLILQLVTDDDGDNGERAFTLPLIGSGTAGRYGFPFVLLADDSYANHTVDNFASGTLDVIERVDARNNDATNAAKVILFAAT